MSKTEVGRSINLHQDRASLPTSRCSAEQWRSTQQRLQPSARCSASIRLSLSVRVAQHRPAASALSVSSMKPPIFRRSTDQWQTAPLGVQDGSRAQYRPPSRSRLAPYEQAQRRAAAQHSAEASAFCSVLSNIAPRSERAGAAPTETSAFSRCSASSRLSLPVRVAQHRPAALTERHPPPRCPSRKSGAVPTSIKIAPRKLRAGAAPSSGAALSRGFSLLLGAQQHRASLRTIRRSTDTGFRLFSVPSTYSPLSLLEFDRHRPAAHCPSWCPSRKSGAVPTSIKIAPRYLRAGAALSRCFSLLLGAHQDREVGRSTDLHHDRASLPTSKRSTQQMLQPSARCSSRSRLSPYEPAQHSAAASAFCSVLSNS